MCVVTSSAASKKFSETLLDKGPAPSQISQVTAKHHTDSAAMTKLAARCPGGMLCAPQQQPRRALPATRHPDYQSLASDPHAPAVVKDRPNQEADARYRRTDYSVELAAEARVAFARCLAAGEAALPLGRAALFIAAEDDAIGELGEPTYPALHPPLHSPSPLSSS